MTPTLAATNESLLHSNELNRCQGGAAAACSEPLLTLPVQARQRDPLPWICHAWYWAVNVWGADTCGLRARQPPSWAPWEPKLRLSWVESSVHGDALSHSLKSQRLCGRGGRVIKTRRDRLPSGCVAERSLVKFGPFKYPRLWIKKRALILSINWCSNHTIFISESRGVILNIAITKSNQLWF